MEHAVHEEVKREEPLSAGLGSGNRGPNIIGNRGDLSDSEPAFHSALGLFDPNKPAAAFDSGQAHEQGDPIMYQEVTPKRTTEQEYRMAQRRPKSKDRKEK